MPSRWLCIAIALLPVNFLRVWSYRLLCRYRIGPRTKIGWLTVVHASEVEIGSECRLDMLVRLTGIRQMQIGSRVRIGRLCHVAGMDRLTVGEDTCFGGGLTVLAPTWGSKYSKPDPAFVVGKHCIITGKHHIDVTHDVTFGDRVTIGGTFSTFWTHGVSRDRTGPIEIGDRCYLGAGVHVGPNVTIAPHTIVGMGAVVTKSFDTPGCTIGGVPARVLTNPNEVNSELSVEDSAS